MELGRLLWDAIGLRLLGALARSLTHDTRLRLARTIERSVTTRDVTLARAERAEARVAAALTIVGRMTRVGEDDRDGALLFWCAQLSTALTAQDNGRGT